MSQRRDWSLCAKTCREQVQQTAVLFDHLVGPKKGKNAVATEPRQCVSSVPEH
jgi:hypothetical protein